MIKIATVFFSTKKNVISLFIAFTLIVLLYTLYLETSNGSKINNHFFGATFVLVPITSFYLFYFNGLFRNNYFRFLAINIRESSYFRFIFQLIGFLAILTSSVSVLLYFILNFIYFKEIQFTFLLVKNIAFLFLFNFFLSCLSFLINCLTTSFWAFFAVIFYLLFEDWLVIFLKNKNIALAEYLPKKNILDVFSSQNFNIFYIIPFLYIFILSFLIFKKNYKLL